MLNEPAKNWVAELRSGKYKQGQHRLRLGDNFCCLGVACELAVKAGIIDPPTVVEGILFFYASEEKCLPSKVAEWLRLSFPNGWYNGNAGLAHQNDEGMSFDQIANIIESEPNGLFESGVS